MSGWVKLHRQIQMNRLWLAEPFTRGQAWIDLILLANHKDAKISARGISITVPRGSVGWSKQKLADRWRWSKGKVNRFLNELETDQQIVQSTGRSLTVISLCNYSKFNAYKKTDGTPNDTLNEPQSSTPNGTESGTQHGTPDGSLTRSKEVKEEKNSVVVGAKEQSRFKSLQGQLVLAGHSEIAVARSRAVISQINSWIVDGVSDGEMADAITETLARFEKRGDTRVPPVAYIASVIQGMRTDSKPVSAGAKKVNTHGGFDDIDYFEGTEGMNVAGGRE